MYYALRILSIIQIHLYAVYFLRNKPAFHLIRAFILQGVHAHCSPSSHTLCLADNPNLVQAGVSVHDKQVLVDLHNQYRSQVASQGTDLLKMVSYSKNHYKRQLM